MLQRGQKPQGTLPFWPLLLAPMQLGYTMKRCVIEPTKGQDISVDSHAAHASEGLNPDTQGRPIDPNNELTLKNVRGTECLRLAWHPLLPLLTIGWRDGGL